MSGRDDDIDFSFNTAFVKDFFKGKHFPTALLILMVLIPVLLTLHIRLLPDNLPATDDMAKNAVDNYYKSGIAQQVYAQYPNLPAAQRDKLVNQQYEEYLKNNKATINEQVKQTGDYFKTGFQYTENGKTYTFLGDLDSYYYLRQARNIQENGYVCDSIADNGQCVDDHMVAPINGGAGASLHPYATVYLYNFLHIFNNKMTLMQSAFILPAIVAALGCIGAFFLARRLMNDVAGFFAAMFLAVSPLFLSRSLGSDTDVWNVALPIIIMWVFVEAFHAKTWITKSILGLTTGALLGLFAFAWGGGWWYTFDFMMLGIIAFAIFELIKGYIKHRKISKDILHELKDTGLILGVMFVSTMIIISLTLGFSAFVSAFTSPLQLSTGLKVAATEDLWGNILTTVAELNEASIGMVIGQLSFGMTFLFSLSLLGLIFLLVNKEPKLKDYLVVLGAAIVYAIAVGSATTIGIFGYMALLLLPLAAALLVVLFDKERHVDIKPAIILMLWFVGMIYASLKGVRFIMLIVPVFSLALGISMGYLYQYISRLAHKDLKIKDIYAKIGVFVILLFVLIVPVQAGYATAESYMPSMTVGWWDSLTKIKNDSNDQAIITSWWDFGHWFKYVADRKVTFDGASQLPPLGHWVGRSFQTNNPDETIGILRMIDCGSNRAFEEVNKKYSDTELSENVISKLILMNKDDAQEYLESLGYTSAEIAEILKYSHCEPPQGYYITSSDMIGKAGVWSHFGLWNIDRAYIVSNLRNEPLGTAVQVMKDRWNYSEEEATRIYYDIQALQTEREMNDWISPWPGYATGSMVGCANISEMVICDFGIGIGNNGQQSYVVERAVINMSNPVNSQALIRVYDGATSARVGESLATWNTVVVASPGGMRTYSAQNATMGLSILINADNSSGRTSYSALVADPALIDSTFTKLYYLNGKGMGENFEKFSDITDIAGTRIIIWKINWPQN